MKLLIEIPENIVENAKSSPNYYPTYHFEKIWRAIAKGTPLSKGHGRLIDADELFGFGYNDYCVFTRKKGNTLEIKCDNWLGTPRLTLSNWGGKYFGTA